MRTKPMVAIAILGLLLASPALAAKPTAGEVGDPESFGRSAKFLGGVLSPGLVLLRGSCAGEELGPNDQCFELAPGDVLTSFDARDIGRMMLPAGSTGTILYPFISPNVNFQFLNATAAGVSNARFNFVPYFTLESAALDDPGLINPQTGQPFNGKVDLGFPGRVWDRSLAAGERARQSVAYTRAGIGGISTGVLREGFGLPDAVIERIFKGPITLRTNVRGTARHVSDGLVTFGARFMGD